MSSNEGPRLSADEALLQLKAGNERFLAGTLRFPTVQKAILADLARGQHIGHFPQFPGTSRCLRPE